MLVALARAGLIFVLTHVALVALAIALSGGS
jgi:hypothetical protein